jgi:hypothetical protein
MPAFWDAFHQRSFRQETQPWIYEVFIQTAESTMEDDMATVMENCSSARIA